MGKYTVNPDSLGGGYSEFRIVPYYHEESDAIEFYNTLKQFYSENKHVLIHIHKGDDDRGVHTYRHTADNTFEVYDFNIAFTTQLLALERWKFKETGVEFESKIIDLTEVLLRIKSLESKVNQLTTE